MPRIIVRAAAICGALPVSGAEVYINGKFSGSTDRKGYSDVYEVSGKGCHALIKADGYNDCRSEHIKLYENTTVVWSAMLESIKVKQGQKNTKNRENQSLN